VRRFVAPGRVNLIGEHTDHTDGLVLPAAIDRVVVLDGTTADRIRLTSATFAGEVDVAADGADAPGQGWGRYVAAVAAELAAAGRPPVGLQGHLTSDLPSGAGLSSSAALEVAVATALCAVADFPMDPLAMAALCRWAEHRAVGVPSGILDQAASLLGRADHAIELDCRTLEHSTVPLPQDLALCVLDSGVRRTLEGSGYGQRRDELEGSLGVLGDRRPAEVDPDELPALTAELPDVPRRRLRHVVTENVRVRDTVAALESDDRPALGRLFAESHASLRDDYEVSVAELDLLVELAGEAGAVAARMTGGGFGGAILALVPHDRVEAVTGQVLERYTGAGHEGRLLVCRAADGAGER